MKMGHFWTESVNVFDELLNIMKRNVSEELSVKPSEVTQDAFPQNPCDQMRHVMSSGKAFYAFD